MVQQSMSEVRGVPVGMPLGEWLGRVTGAVRDAVLPDEGDASSVVDAAGPAWLRRLVPRLALIAAGGLLVVSVALFAFRAVYADTVYPAVAVGDVEVGGMTADEAVATIEQRAAQLERGTVTFTLNGQTWTPTLAEIGAEVDVEASVDAAYALGREDNAVTRLGVANQLLRDDQRVPLRITVDRGVLASWFESVNADIDQRAVDASLVVEGAEVTISPEVSGTVVNEAAATDMILGALGDLDPVAAALPTTVELPQIYADDLAGPREELAAAIDDPIVAVFEGEAWEIAPKDLTRFLTVETVVEDGTPGAELSVDRDALAAWLRDTFSDRVNRAPVDARVAWSADNGGLVSLDVSETGAALRSSAFASAVTESFLSDQGRVEVPVVVTRPGIDSDNLGALGIDGRISRATSNFDGGSETRDTNISIGTELVNGELIAPGEEFSFNGAVGEITYDRGFVDAGVIENGIIGRDVGGGICQVSTTVFRAALLSGMPITEWWAHSMRLTAYERDGWTAGYDASILQSGSNPEYWADFRFRNETDSYMLVQSWNEYPYNVVEIYGNDDGRTVDLTEPQFANPGEAYVAWHTRVVTYADGTSAERTFESYYSPAS